MVSAVLFDLDGTLIDTEPSWMAAERALVRRFGGAWTEQDAKSLVGSDLLRAAEELRDRGGVRMDPPAIVDQMLDAVLADVSTSMPWRPGALELLAACRAAGVPTGLVTMSYRSLADAVLAHLPSDAFDTVVTGDEVTRGKPHPEPYLTACERLDARPAQTVAIEDSPTGVASARAAGCAVLAVPFHVPVVAAAGTTVVTSLTGVTVATLASLVAGARD